MVVAEKLAFERGPYWRTTRYGHSVLGGARAGAQGVRAGQYMDNVNTSLLADEVLKITLDLKENNPLDTNQQRRWCLHFCTFEQILRRQRKRCG